MPFAEHAALQAGVHGDQFGSVAQDLLVYGLRLRAMSLVGSGFHSG
jgi:hypothetical protein